MTMKELKRRFEAQEPLTKKYKASLRGQLSRTCKKYGCTESLAFRAASLEYCKPQHAKPPVVKEGHKKYYPNKSKAEIKKLNKLKRQTYYDRHGISFTANIRRKVSLGQGVELGEHVLLYEDYKEPLKRLPKTEGFGYYGTVALSQDRKYVQCHICGNLYKSLGMHIRQHKLTAKAYKTRYGLSVATALVGDSTREAMQNKAVKPFDGKLPPHLIEYNRKVQQGLIKHMADKPRDDYSLEWRNKRGLCPDQVLDKIRTLADELGHAPSHDEFRNKYKGRFMGTIRYLHGTYSEAVKKLGLQTANELRSPDKEKLIKELQDFQIEYGRIPMTSDFNRGLLRDRGVYIRKFGTLNNARIEAGMDAVLPMPFGQIVTLSPQEYADYKAGRGISSEATKQRNARATRKARRLATARDLVI